MAGLKSKPFKSPWGIHKTRVTLRSRRIEAAIGRTPTGRKSIMPMRMFDEKLQRFDDSWSPRRSVLRREGGK